MAGVAGDGGRGRPASGGQHRLQPVRADAACRRRWPGRGAGNALALVADLLKQGKLVAPLPQRFTNPRAYYLVLAERAATNPAMEPFRLWLASRVKSGVGRTKLST
jgi:DNA-binding transcriptional LysR family regulator